MRRFVDERTRGTALVVLFRILQIRRRCLVSTKGEDLLEMSLDAFRVLDFRGQRYRLHRTLEAELLPGADASCMPAFADSLCRLVALEPELLSKYEHARDETVRA